MVVTHEPGAPRPWIGIAFACAAYLWVLLVFLLTYNDAWRYVVGNGPSEWFATLAMLLIASSAIGVIGMTTAILATGMLDLLSWGMRSNSYDGARFVMAGGVTGYLLSNAVLLNFGTNDRWPEFLLGPLMASLFGQLGAAWGVHRDRHLYPIVDAPWRWRFNLRQLLIVTALVSALLLMLRLAGLLEGWFLGQLTIWLIVQLGTCWLLLQLLRGQERP